MKNYDNLDPKIAEIYTQFDQLGWMDAVYLSSELMQSNPDYSGGKHFKYFFWIRLARLSFLKTIAMWVVGFFLCLFSSFALIEILPNSFLDSFLGFMLVITLPFIFYFRLLQYFGMVEGKLEIQISTFFKEIIQFAKDFKKISVVIILMPFLVYYLLRDPPIDPGLEATALLTQQVKSPDSFVLIDDKIVWEGQDQEGNPAYVVKVNYSATNSFNARLRGCEMVAFYIKDKKINYNKNKSFEKCYGEEGKHARWMALWFTDP